MTLDERTLENMHIVVKLLLVELQIDNGYTKFGKTRSVLLINVPAILHDGIKSGGAALLGNGEGGFHGDPLQHLLVTQVLVGKPCISKHFPTEDAKRPDITV